MLFIKILVWAIILGILTYFFERLIRKQLGIEKDKDAERYINQFHKWGERIIYISFYGYIFYSIMYDLSLEATWVVLASYFVVYFGFMAFMQWKYLKNSREYIVTIISYSFLALLLIISYFYLPLFLE